MFALRCILLGILSHRRERCHRTLWNVGMGAAPAGGELTWLRAPGRPWVSVRPHYGGLPPKLAGRGQACGAKSPRVATSPEARTRVLRRRGGAPRGVAVCLCLPAIRETCRGRYQVAPFGASTSLSLPESEALNLPHT